MKHASLLIILITCAFTALSKEVLFSDDFSSGELESNWMLYGDPQSGILDSLGIPPPCFINNGDSMWGSGVFSRNVYEVGEGLGVECDMYLECSERGAWVSACICLVTSEYRNERTQTDYSIASVYLTYLGELNWQKPHLQCTLIFVVNNADGVIFVQELYHQNQLLNNWQTFRIEITVDRFVSFFIDDSLMNSSPIMIPDTVEEIRIQLGERSSDWGIALHDNLVVYRP